MWPYSLDDAIKTFGKLFLQFTSTFFVRFEKTIQFPGEHKNITDYRKHYFGHFSTTFFGVKKCKPAYKGPAIIKRGKAGANGGMPCLTSPYPPLCETHFFADPSPSLPHSLK